jgi:hypothetical protein
MDPKVFLHFLHDPPKSPKSHESVTQSNGDFMMLVGSAEMARECLGYLKTPQDPSRPQKVHLHFFGFQKFLKVRGLRRTFENAKKSKST